MRVPSLRPRPWAAGLAVLPILAVAAPAQGRAEAQVPRAALDYRVAVHRPLDASSASRGEADALWASGPDYKVSFGGGFEFYPVLGPAFDRHLQLRWRTLSVSRGEHRGAFEHANRVRHSTDWRVEYRQDGMTEAYDVLATGVEQTFTFERPVPGSGDLVITGQIRTPLVCDAVERAHTALTFADPNDPAKRSILRYGEAHAFDAAGRTTAVTTSFDGTLLSLTVDGAWLAEASYPVTVDPLTSRYMVGFASYAGPLAPWFQHPKVDLAYDDKFDQFLAVYHRRVTSTDSDVYGRLLNPDFSSIGPVFAFISQVYADDGPKVAQVGGADKWVVAFWRRDTFFDTCSVRAYVHDKNDTNLNSGLTADVPKLSNEQDTSPDVGGTDAFSSGTNAFIVFQRDLAVACANTPYSDAYGVMLDASTALLGTPFLLASSPSGSTHDRDWPAVNQVSDGGTASWIATWQEFDHRITLDDWDAAVARFEHDGTRGGSVCLGPCGNNQEHVLRPQVEGRGERYLLSYAVEPNSGYTTESRGDEIRVQRFDWQEVSMAPNPTTLGAEVTLDRYWFLVTGKLENGGGMGYDSEDRSHWCVAWETELGDIRTARVGYRGNAVETVEVYDTMDLAENPCVAFVPAGVPGQGSFAILWSVDEYTSGYPVFATSLQYDPSAGTQSFGVSCAGTISADTPNLGSEFWAVRLRGGRSNAASALILSGAPSAPIPLSPGCFLNIAPPLVFAYLTTTGGTGALDATLSLSVPGRLFFQFIQLDPATSALVSSGAMSADIH